MSQLIAGMRCFSATWAHDGGDVTVAVPDGWRVHDVVSEITEAFDGDGTATVGYTGDPDAFLRDADQGNGAAGVYEMRAGGAANKNGYTLGPDEDVEIAITPGTSTQGEGIVYVYAHPVVA